MKKYITLVLLFASLISFAQFPARHIKLLKNIDSKLSDKWTATIKTREYFNSILEISVINIDLFTDLTADPKGNNEGVSIYLFNKSDSSSVNSYAWSSGNTNSEYKFSETTNYLIVMAYFSSNGEIYDRLVAKLIPQLDSFILDNKNKL
ncbi:MAG: hypothetical protein K0S33_4274 [Bacteroidetes bacterium]|jgi:hypothetical protein|nr:hypothetical protein [Bacteroidota bacterium]